MENKSVIIENVTHLPKTQAKIAAGFLVLTSLPTPQPLDVTRLKPQAKVFIEPDSWVNQQRGQLLAIQPQSPANLDVTRLRGQAKVFVEPEPFANAQRGSSNVLQPSQIVVPTQILASLRTVIVENVSWVHPQRSSPLVTNVPQVVVTSGDIFISQDVYGWPESDPVWINPARGSFVVDNSFTQYNPGTDARRAKQSQYFQEPDAWSNPQGQHTTVLNFAYIFVTDVTRFGKQSKWFIEPDAFVRPQAPLSPALNFKSYVPGTDIRRAKQALYFEEPPAFVRSFPANLVVILSGKAGAITEQYIPLATNLDAYDYLNGSLLLAWSELIKPAAASYNIYQRVSTSSSWALVGSVPASATGGFQFKVSGLQIARYNSATQAMTPSLTYEFKVVAVGNQGECASSSITVTPGPQSVMLVTPMKRLWPFPNTGLD